MEGPEGMACTRVGRAFADLTQDLTHTHTHTHTHTQTPTIESARFVRCTSSMDDHTCVRIYVFTMYIWVFLAGKGP